MNSPEESYNIIHENRKKVERFFEKKQVFR